MLLTIFYLILDLSLFLLFYFLLGWIELLNHETEHAERYTKFLFYFSLNLESMMIFVAGFQYNIYNCASSLYMNNIPRCSWLVSVRLCASLQQGAVKVQSYDLVHVVFLLK